jgi:hypothetical protein
MLWNTAAASCTALSSASSGVIGVDGTFEIITTTSTKISREPEPEPGILVNMDFVQDPDIVFYAGYISGALTPKRGEFWVRSILAFYSNISDSFEVPFCQMFLDRTMQRRQS